VPWKGQNPREHPVLGVLNPRSGARDSSEGSKPRNRALSGRPVLRYRKNDGSNGMWVHPAGDGAGTFREEKAPKGEIPGALPARNKAGAVQREKTVKRVTKP